MSENCEKCKASLEFPSSREVLAKKRDCPACGHSQAVHKSILFVVETLEEQNADLHARLSAVEAKLGIETRPLPSAVPPKRARVQKPAPVDILGDVQPVPAPSGTVVHAAAPVDLFADVVPQTLNTLPDLF